MPLARTRPLASLTTFGVGGAADELLHTRSYGEVAELVRSGRFPPQLTAVVGGGSNLLVSDAGVAGTVLLHRSDRPSGLRRSGEETYWIDAADDWDLVARDAAKRGLQGIETLVGIPGTVGGALVQNIGAYGYELSEVVQRVKVLDLETLEILDLSPGECGFAYRNSGFKGCSPPRVLVLDVALRLRVGQRHEARYEELRARLELASASGAFYPATVAEEVLNLRRAKSMVFTAGDPETRGAGSFFKNPEVPVEEFHRLTRQLRLASSDMPHWLRPKGFVRLSAGWLVELAGFHRGFAQGNVGLCKAHALGIVNRSGEASASEIRAFARRIQVAVNATSGILLQPEPVLLGASLED